MIIDLKEQCQDLNYDLFCVFLKKFGDFQYTNNNTESAKFQNKTQQDFTSKNNFLAVTKKFLLFSIMDSWHYDDVVEDDTDTDNKFHGGKEAIIFLIDIASPGIESLS